MEHLHERHESLWMLTIAPSIWFAHFMLSYLTAALWCGKVAGPAGSLGDVRTAIAWYTAVALTGIAAVAAVEFRRYSHGHETAPHDSDTPEDRHRFLGFATLLLAGLSGVATVYVALAAVFIRTCG